MSNMMRELCGLGLTSPLKSRRRPLKNETLEDAFADGVEGDISPMVGNGTNQGVSDVFIDDTRSPNLSAIAAGGVESCLFDMQHAAVGTSLTPAGTPMKNGKDPDFPWLSSPLPQIESKVMAAGSPCLLALMQSPPTSAIHRRRHLSGANLSSPFFFGLDNDSFTPDAQSPARAAQTTQKKRMRQESIPDVKQRAPPATRKAGRRKTGQAEKKASDVSSQVKSGRVALLTFGSAHGVHLKSADGLVKKARPDSPSLMNPSPLWSSQRQQRKLL